MTDTEKLIERLWKAAHDYATAKGGFLPGDTIFAEAASALAAAREREKALGEERGTLVNLAAQGAIALRRRGADYEAGLIDAGLHALEMARAASLLSNGDTDADAS